MKPKIKGSFSVAGEKLKDRIKPGMPAEQIAQIEHDADMQAVRDVFGAGVEFDSNGNPIESGVGSTKWLVSRASEAGCERHFSAIGRFIGPAAERTEREKIARLRAKK